MFCQIDEITFDRINSPESFTESENTTFAQHPRLGKKDKLIKTGEGLRSLSISLALSLSEESNPKKPEEAISRLRQLRKRGEPVSFILANGRLVGRYVIVSMTSTPTQTDPKGNYITADIDLQLREFKNEYKREWS